MVKYFEQKLDLCGLKNLVKDNTLDDLDQDDRAALDVGFMHILPKRIPAGKL